jgi:hypothetical protein
MVTSWLYVRRLIGPSINRFWLQPLVPQMLALMTQKFLESLGSIFHQAAWILNKRKVVLVGIWMQRWILIGTYFVSHWIVWLSCLNA